METEQLPIDFGDLELRLDPWQVDYGDQTLVESPSAEPDQGIDVEVEVEGPWWPIVPPEAPEARPPLIFVDGVRRLEARVIVQARGAIAHGVFASYAVGSVEIGAEARFGSARIERVILLGSGIRPSAVEAAAGLLFRPESTEDEDPEAPVNEVQALMQRSEAELVGELATEDGALVIADGPLHFDQPFQRAVGYVKRFARLYVPASHLGVLARPPAGGRSPLFGLKQPRAGRRPGPGRHHLPLPAAAFDPAVAGSPGAPEPGADRRPRAPPDPPPRRPAAGPPTAPDPHGKEMKRT